MKKKFNATIHRDIPNGIKINKWLNGETLASLVGKSDTPFWVITHSDYTCVEYHTKLNVFTFGKLNFRLPITVIGPPFSVDSVAYQGHLDSLIADYKNRKGIFLILNLSKLPTLTEKVALGETLPNCMFYNRFSSFDEYLSALRGSYRRRLKQALNKGKLLQIRQIQNSDFSDELYGLYLQVLHHSKYPLETLYLDFFKTFDGKIFTFSYGGKPLAFVMVKNFDSELDFVFGGMDYTRRNQFDLYYNMLLFILRQGIEQGVECIGFGQTAEHSKQRMGCVLEKRHMIAFCGNPTINLVLRIAKKGLSYQAPNEIYHAMTPPPNTTSPS